ncbi:MAG TPA: DUF4105 domain-containing protein [Tepidisphaeraceae bacterium]|jgi:hypothetical protein
MSQPGEPTSPEGAAGATPAPAAAAAQTAAARRSPLLLRCAARAGRCVGIGLLALLLSGMAAWATLAVYYADTRPDAGPRRIAAALVALACAALLVFVRPRRLGLACFVLLFGAVLAWFFLRQPSNDRDWEVEVSRAPQATLDGDRLVVRNVRNFDYRSETDFTPHWDDRSYDLATLRSADFMLVYWGSKAIAHAMVSFGFADGRYLAISIETRKEKGESYSTVQGFFRQFELIYVFADERDVVRLRTNYRIEDVYLYRSTFSPAEARALLTSYARRADELRLRPQFYNALTSNCATNVLDLAQESPSLTRQGMNWEILLSGYAARRAYRNGRIDTSLPFDQLQARSRVNDAAHAADRSPDFSRIIRAGLPMPPASQ